MTTMNAANADYRTATPAELADHDARVARAPIPSWANPPERAAAPVHGPAGPDAITSFIHRLDGHVDVLDRALTQWEDRDDTKAQPEVRRAASTAMTEIDAMLAGLNRLRQVLVSEIRASDAAAVTRADAMLARHREQRADEILPSALAAAQAPADPEAWELRVPGLGLPPDADGWVYQ